MIAKQILDALTHIFGQEKCRIVFWYDVEAEFSSDIADLGLDGVKVFRLDEMGALEVKMRLETDDTEDRYVLYAPYTQPENKDNWLLDIQLYSRVFHADSISILLDDLGLARKSLRAHLSQRRKFLANKERVAHLKRWLAPDDTEHEIDLKMLAVTVKAEQPDIDAMLLTLYGECCADGLESGLFKQFEDLAASWSNIKTYGLEDSFWQLAAERFSYLKDVEHRSLRDLLFCLLATDFANAYRDATPSALRSFVLPDRNLGRNASVFLANWRANAGHFMSYGALSEYAQRELGLDAVLTQCDWRHLLDVMTFSCVEKCILSQLRDLAVEASKGQKPDEIWDISRIRRDGHWTRPLLARDGVNHYAAAYHAIDRAANLFSMRWELSDGLHFADADAACASYVTELSQFDQNYRLFHEHAEQVQQKGWDILKSLSEAVEGCYSGWFLQHLAVAWGEHLPGDNGLLATWRLSGCSAQHRFYRDQVAPRLKESAKARVFVIVSDAFRYELGQELHADLIAKNRFAVSIEPMLSVLPSYTSLGMAALLPHADLSFKDQKTATVMVDGQNTSSTEYRRQILSSVNGTALTADEVMAMRKEEGREFIKPYRVVYVYHDAVDATGDKRASEGRTFEACRKAIRELSDLVGFLINSLNASAVLVTADHGFLYTDAPLEVADKSKLEQKPEGALDAKKRYIVGHDLGAASNVWAGHTSATAGMTNGAEFWVPKGVGRFHFVGGARYIHGGAMPQEVIVPVVTAHRARGKHEAKAQVRKVDISPLEAGQIRITNTIRRFEFIQLDPVSDKVLPRTVEVFIREDDRMLSNIAKMTFEGVSEALEQRKHSVQLTIMAGQYEKAGEYRLVVRDADTNVEMHCLPVTIDLAFGTDF